LTIYLMMSVQRLPSLAGGQLRP